MKGDTAFGCVTLLIHDDKNFFLYDDRTYYMIVDKDGGYSCGTDGYPDED